MIYFIRDTASGLIKIGFSARKPLASRMTPADFVHSRGAERLAEIVGVKPGTIYVWAHRRIIPRTAWPEIQLVLPDVSVRDLLAIEANGAKAEAA